MNQTKRAKPQKMAENCHTVVCVLFTRWGLGHSDLPYNFRSGSDRIGYNKWNTFHCGCLSIASRTPRSLNSRHGRTVCLHLWVSSWGSKAGFWFKHCFTMWIWNIMDNQLVPLPSVLSRTNIHVLLNNFTWHASTSRVLRKIGVARLMRSKKRCD